MPEQQKPDDKPVTSGDIMTVAGGLGAGAGASLALDAGLATSGGGAALIPIYGAAGAGIGAAALSGWHLGGLIESSDTWQRIETAILDILAPVTSVDQYLWRPIQGADRADPGRLEMFDHMAAPRSGESVDLPEFGTGIAIIGLQNSRDAESWEDILWT
ncbi:MAG: hypothetical protein V4693_18965 [Pseudomonadota bacterium]